jgi:hypothetical protein
MSVYVIDQFVDTRGLGHDVVLRRMRDVTYGMLRGQIAEVLGTDDLSLPEMVEWSANRPVDILEATVNHGQWRFVLLHT